MSVMDPDSKDRFPDPSGKGQDPDPRPCVLTLSYKVCIFGLCLAYGSGCLEAESGSAALFLHLMLQGLHLLFYVWDERRA